ncbi:transcriptional regulator [Ktedonosporobacter rubrisoli]|uniref:Transcriptional regulator n=1 Tax=Ktedonosporobacter rubrisoli TaxID=2509675 RepID=A0A4P6JLU5_KTERU|nr:helix-turn-helix transcriptional regulator [Ktedonosporobacter rubrisoli]QBD76237.1 transcriptional regulator [Ktedonosporobacter rubrisoli]
MQPGTEAELIFDPLSLRTVTALANCERADTTFLRRLLGVSPQALESHLLRLQEARLIKREERSNRRFVRLSAAGRQATFAYLRAEAEEEQVAFSGAAQRPGRLKISLNVSVALHIGYAQEAPSQEGEPYTSDIPAMRSFLPGA